MVLCPNHHDESKVMDEAEQRALKAMPHNIRQGLVLGLLRMKQDYSAIDAGGGVYLVGDKVGFTVDGHRIFSIGKGMDKAMQVSARLYSNTGTLLAEVVDNEWISGDPFAWDIEAGWQHLLVREKSRLVSLEIDANYIPAKVKGHLWHNRFEFRLQDKGLFWTNYNIVPPKNFSHTGGMALVNLDLEIDTAAGSVNYKKVVGEVGAFIGEANPRQRLYKAKEFYLQQSRKTGGISPLSSH